VSRGDKQAAKRRIETNPHHTLYHAIRVLGRLCSEEAVSDLAAEIEFTVSCTPTNSINNTTQKDEQRRPHSPNPHHTPLPPTPRRRIVLTRTFLQHDTVQSAVIAVPAKFDSYQRASTVRAFRNAGVSVARILEEPMATALAYGLHKKDGCTTLCSTTLVVGHSM